MNEDWREKLKATTQEERQAHLIQRLGWTKEDVLDMKKSRKDKDIPWNILLVSRPSDEDMEYVERYLASPGAASLRKRVQELN